MSIKHFFVCGNTAKGFRDLFSTNIQDLEKLFILKGGPGTGKSTLMKRIGKDLESLQYDIEYIHCSSDPDSLDGVLAPKLGFGVVDGTSPHVIEPRAPGAKEEYVNLGVAWDVEKLGEHTDGILELQRKMKNCYVEAYGAFAKGLQVHDRWEKIYIDQMDFDKANLLGEKVVVYLLDKVSFPKESCIKHRFLGGSTPYGPKDFVENITDNMKKRYFIKGRPGSGKSTMLKKILRNAILRGVDVEVYHCGFDPDSLDMLVFPELSLCIFDSTAPHEYFPSREGDFVIDMYEELITSGTDEKYAKELDEIKREYRSCIDQGTQYLSQAKGFHDQLEKFYVEATDFEVIDSIYDELYEKMRNLTQR